MDTLRGIQDLIERFTLMGLVFLRRNWLAVVLVVAVGSVITTVIIDTVAALKDYVGSKERVVATGLLAATTVMVLPTWWAAVLAFPFVFGALLLIWRYALTRRRGSHRMAIQPKREEDGDG